MAAKVSPSVTQELYKSDNEQPVPVVVHPKPVDEEQKSAASNSIPSAHKGLAAAVSDVGSSTSETRLTKEEEARETVIDGMEEETNVDQNSARKLNFKGAANLVRRSSVDSIGNAADLLHPSSAAKRDENLDEPDFWDKISQYTMRMKKDARYYFQHPYARLLVAYLVTFCNFLIYAEDPVAHSNAECNIVGVGNVYSFVVTKYPPNGFSALKVFLWVSAIAIGILIGKFVIHRLLLKRLFKLQMFQEDMGSFMIMFLTTLVSLFTFSWLYNAFLMLDEDMAPYAITGYMRMKNSTFMKAAATGTWLGDFFTAWMVTDVMLQEKFYPHWARPVKTWWNRGYNRIILFWCLASVATFLVVLVISTDWIRWDNINASFLATNELSRAFLASFILVMDLLIVIQDWDFPHFLNHFDIKLPGLNTADLKIEIPRCLKRFEKITIHITGKWFNYGIIFLVMILDLNMWKNQIFYEPKDYAQYTDDRDFIFSHPCEGCFLKPEGANLTTDNSTNWFDKNTRMESRFHGYNLPIKAIAFVPSLAAFAVFVALIIVYGRVKPTKSDPYAGRLQKIKRKSTNLNMFAIAKMKLFGKRKAKTEVNVEEHSGNFTSRPKEEENANDAANNC